MSNLLTLRSSSLEAAISPSEGGRLTSVCFVSGKQRIPITPEDPSGFHMVPYSNRIRDGAFDFEGKSYLLSDGERHALHGVARKLPWRVASQSHDRAVLEFESVPAVDSRGVSTTFPFAYRATIAYRIEGSALFQELSIINTGSARMPAGGGFHPYFLSQLERGGPVQLRFSVKGVYPVEKDVPLPTGPAEPLPTEMDCSQLRDAPIGLDHCFSGWDGKAELVWPGSGLKCVISGDKTLPHLIVYSPPGKNFIAVEPVSNMNDAVNFLGKAGFETGLCLLEPGKTFTMTCSYAIEQA